MVNKIQAKVLSQQWQLILWMHTMKKYMKKKIVKKYPIKLYLIKEKWTQWLVWRKINHLKVGSKGSHLLKTTKREILSRINYILYKEVTLIQIIRYRDSLKTKKLQQAKERIHLNTTLQEVAEWMEAISHKEAKAI